MTRKRAPAAIREVSVIATFKPSAARSICVTAPLALSVRGTVEITNKSLPNSPWVSIPLRCTALTSLAKVLAKKSKCSTEGCKTCSRKFTKPPNSPLPTPIIGSALPKGSPTIVKRPISATSNCAPICKVFCPFKIKPEPATEPMPTLTEPLAVVDTEIFTNLDKSLSKRSR